MDISNGGPFSSLSELAFQGNHMEVHRAYVSHLRSLRASWWTRHEERLLSRCEEENFAQASSIERMRGTENYTQLLEDFDRACTYYCKHFVHIVFEACRDDPEVDDSYSTAPSTAVSPCVGSGATRATPSVHAAAPLESTPVAANTLPMEPEPLETSYIVVDNSGDLTQPVE